MTQKVEKIVKAKAGIRLDIACGANKQGADWVGIDIQKLPGVDIVHDIETYPWPLPDSCVLISVASHIVEHINPAKFGFINFMNEIWRITKPGGQLAIATPYAGSLGYYQDPTHVNPCNEVTWSYFDPEDVRTGGQLYKIYQPKPWKIVHCSFSTSGQLEVILEKRKELKNDSKR